jgi:hypothetical protein
MQRIILLFVTLWSGTALAAPAFQGSQTLTNGDGSTFTGQLQGDPWFHYAQDNNGRIIVYDTGSGNYEFADYDTSGTRPHLSPSGVKAGTSPGSHGVISPAQLQAARAAARSSISQATLSALLTGHVWYSVEHGTVKTLYKVSFNGTSSTKWERVKPDANPPIKTNSVHLSGQILVNDSVNHLYYYTFAQHAGYLEVAIYQQGGGSVLTQTDTTRWYPHLADALAYYNTP